MTMSFPPYCCLIWRRIDASLMTSSFASMNALDRIRVSVGSSSKGRKMRFSPPGGLAATIHRYWSWAHHTNILYE
jgi:hypothetical protein